MKKTLFCPWVAVAVLMLTVFHYGCLWAKVSGRCDDCHTMHSSQDGVSAVGGPYETLLTDDCVGCHSHETAETIKMLGESRVPVVYNAVEPNQELAGGNFFWVVDKGDEYGHNVLSISNVQSDSNLSTAPGRPDSAVGALCDDCHKQVTSCESCHTPAHHADDSDTVVGETGGWYRFLKSGATAHDGGGVEGIEDPDWEHDVTSARHNEYQGATTSAFDSGANDSSMSDYCAGCHQFFHSEPNVGDQSPWFLHPAHYALPSDPNKEYHLYNTQDGVTIGPYNPQAPVAREDVRSLDGPSEIVTPGSDQVFCLSCHRVHGTPNKAILRWAYQGMIAGTTGNTAGTGCFVCHTAKDGM
jgi:hypothetical protein